MSNGGHFPAAPVSDLYVWRQFRALLQYTDHSRFGFMKHQVIDLVVAMDGVSSVFRLCVLVLEIRNRFIDVGYLANGDLRFDVYGF